MLWSDKQQSIMRSRLANALVAVPSRQSRGWVCQECLNEPKTRWLSSAPKDKPYYITSPIFYVNGGKASQALGRNYNSTDTSCSTSHWPPLHTSLGRHFEAMAYFVRQEIYTRYGDRRARNEGMLKDTSRSVEAWLMYQIGPTGS